MKRLSSFLYTLLFFSIHKFVVLGSSFYYVFRYRDSFPIRTFGDYLDFALIQNFVRWDAEWYLNIAQKSYYSFQSSAFFPLYPYSIRGLSEITGLSYRLSGIIIANVMFFLAIYLLLRLLSLDFKREVVLRTLLLLVAFPTSFYFSAIYTESMFLFWTVGCFYFARKQNWWWAGIFGFFASLTRNTGVLLGLPFLYEYLASRNFEWRKVRADLLSITLLPAGIAAFMLLLYNKIGDPLGFVHSQKLWNRVFHWPWETLWYGGRDLLFKPRTNWSRINHTFDTLVAYWEILTSFLSLLVKKFQMRWSYWLYMTAAVIVPLFSPSIPNSYFYSVPRFVIVLFPVFVVWALIITKRRWLIPLLLLGFIGQIYIMDKFTKGLFVY